MTPPSKPLRGEIHAWVTALAADVETMVRLEKSLSPDELLRANRLRDPIIRDRFIAGRGILREILARYLKRDPGSLQLVQNEHCKPRLAENEKGEVLNFNVSHTGELAVLAVCVDCEVGVDIERVRDDLPFRGMAQRYFSPHERKELFSLPHEQQLAAFYRCWTRKEAYLKGCGTGFTRPSDSFDVSLLPGHPPALLAHRIAPGEPARWSLLDIDVQAGFCAAIAVEGNITAVHYLAR